MPTSSAKPGKLLQYRNDGLAQVAQWEPEVTNLTTALADLRSALAAVELPEECQITVLYHETWFDTLTKNQRHLDEWVGLVGTEFLRANGLTALLNQDISGFADLLLTADDSALRVGYADRALAERAAAGAQAAADLRALLDSSGLLADGAHGYLSPGAQTDELMALMERIGVDLSDEAFAVGFFNALGLDGIRASVSFFTSLGEHESVSVTMTPKARPLLGTFAHGFALASGSLTPEIRDGLLNFGDAPHDRRENELQLGLLLSADGRHYNPQFLAQAADRLLFDTDRGGPGVPQALALRALAGNTEASWLFADRGTDHLEVLLRPFTDLLPHAGRDAMWLGATPNELPGLVEQWSGDIIGNAFGDAVVENPQRYERSLDLYADVVRMVGEGEIANPVRRSLAETLVIYLPAIGESAYLQSEAGYYADAAARDGHDFNRPDLVNFFQELGRDREAAMAVGRSITTWAEIQSVIFLDGTYPTDSEIDRAFIPVAQVLGAVEDGFDAIGEESRAAKEAAARGIGLTGGIISAGAGLTGMVAGLSFPPALPIIAGVGGATWMGMSFYALELPDTAEVTPVPGTSLENMLLQQLERDLAIAVAEQQHPGQPPPGPGEYKDTFFEAWDEGDPYARFRSRANNEVRHSADQHWSDLFGGQQLTPGIVGTPGAPEQLRDVIAQLGPPGQVPPAPQPSATSQPTQPTQPSQPPTEPSQPTQPTQPSQPPGGSEPTAPAGPAPGPQSEPPRQVRADGESFWTIAEEVLARDGNKPSEREVRRYWRQLIAANQDRLVDPDNPHLLRPGQELVIPAPRR